MNQLNHIMMYSEMPTSRIDAQLIIRRNLLKNLALIIPAISFSPLFASIRPENHSLDNQLLEEDEIETIRTFILSALPDFEDYCETLIAELNNDFYNFAKYLRFLVNNLNESSRGKFNRSFRQLNDAERALIIEDGKGGGIDANQNGNEAIDLLLLIVTAGLGENDNGHQLLSQSNSTSDLELSAQDIYFTRNNYSNPVAI